MHTKARINCLCDKTIVIDREQNETGILFVTLVIYFFVALVIWCKTSFTLLCSKDALRITDGKKTLGVYCGNRTGQNLLVTGDKVEMTFKSDDKVEQRGYYLLFTLVSSHGKWGHKEAD